MLTLKILKEIFKDLEKSYSFNRMETHRTVINRIVIIS